MFTVNLIALFSLLVVCASGLPSAAPGYLFINTSQTPFCYDLTPNEICPSNLVNYQILGYDRTTQEIAKVELESVKLVVQTLDFFVVSDACRESVREYSCSNTFAVCTPDSKYGVNLKYNYQKTKAACARVQSNCPKIAADAIVYNCSLIQKDVAGYISCAELPEVPGDVCPKSSYTYPKALGPFYEAGAKAFPATLASMVKQKLFTSPACEKEFIDIYCQLLRGSICSTDNKLRMYAISQQFCAAIYTKCISGRYPPVEDFFLQTCKLFPDARIAKRVPLPPGVTDNRLNYN